MNEKLSLVLAWMAGGALGAIFFGGLWWTVRKGMASSRPVLWVFASFLLRTGIALAGFYFVSGGDWQRLLACLAGFVMARMVVTRLTRLPEESQKDQKGQTPPTPKASHAP
ncbi:MAG: ATP synthase subunit I [Polaromonas sp.]